jgi:hypothetical protein
MSSEQLREVIAKIIENISAQIPGYSNTGAIVKAMFMEKYGGQIN